MEPHPAAPHHLPVYLAGPDGHDPLFTITVVVLLVIFLLAGVLYFKLHSLPEHLGEKANSTQLQLISFLAILALFTHNNAFWVIALLVAAVRVPDYLTPIETIAASLQKISEQQGASSKSEDRSTIREPRVEQNLSSTAEDEQGEGDAPADPGPIRGEDHV